MKKTKFILVGLGLFSAVGLASLFLYPPGFLRVKEVAVITPLKHLSELELIRLSGVKKGDNLARLRLAKVRHDLFRSPWIRDVQLSKRIPGRLLIWVYEQEPAAILDLRSGEKEGLYFVNGEGKVFKKVEETDSDLALPKITGLSEEEISLHLRPILSLVRSFDRFESLRPLGIFEIHRGRDGALSLTTSNPDVRMELGKKDWEEGLLRLSRSWETIRTTTKDPKMVDLSYRRRIVVKQQF